MTLQGKKDFDERPIPGALPAAAIFCNVNSKELCFAT
jgi:hypothetical protein